MQTINERVSIVVKVLANGKQIELCEKAGIAGGTLNNIIGKKQSNPSFDTLEKICIAYPKLNRNWFFNGVGEITSPQDFDCAQEIQKLSKKIEALERERMTLMKTIEKLLTEDSPKLLANLMKTPFALPLQYQKVSD